MLSGKSSTDRYLFVLKKMTSDVKNWNNCNSWFVTCHQCVSGPPTYFVLNRLIFNKMNTNKTATQPKKQLVFLSCVFLEGDHHLELCLSSVSLLLFFLSSFLVLSHVNSLFSGTLFELHKSMIYYMVF